MPVDLLAQPKDLLAGARKPIDLLDKTAPKQSFFDNLINTGSEVIKDIPAQIQDLMNIPAALLGTPRPAMKSKLATETVSYIMEKATTPVGDIPIKTLSYNDVRNIASGRFTYTESQVSPSLLDIGFYGLMGASVARNQLALARWNNQLNKLIKTEEVRGAVMNNIESFESLMTQAGIKMEGMDLTAKTDFILSQAKSSPKLGTAIMDLVSGKIAPKAPIASQPIETPAVTPETPIVAPKPTVAPIAPQAVENPLPLAIRLKSGEVISDATAKLHSDIVSAKGINPDDVQDVGIMQKEGYQATKLSDAKGGAPLESLPEVPEGVMKKVKGIIGTGETKTRGLAKGVEEKAIENKLTETFSGLPEYQTVNMKEQAGKAQDLLTKDYEKAKRIAMGEELSPGDVLPESVFVAVENKAVAEQDVATLKDLATSSSLSEEATTMGQRIQTLAERNPESPVSAINEISKVREKRAGEKLKIKDVKKAKKEVVKQVQAEIKKVAPTKENWADFIRSIQC